MWSVVITLSLGSRWVAFTGALERARGVLSLYRDSMGFDAALEAV